MVILTRIIGRVDTCCNASRLGEGRELTLVTHDADPQRVTGRASASHVNQCPVSSCPEGHW